MNYSPGVVVAWHLAGREAGAAKMQFIEPEHFFEALTKLTHLSDSDVADFLHAGTPTASDLRPELDLVTSVLEDFELDPDTLRRRLRQQVGQGAYTFKKGETVHRSQRSRAMFGRAEAVAKEEGAKQVTAGHLFIAILHEEDSHAYRLLHREGVDPQALAESTRQRTALLAKQDAPSTAQRTSRNRTGAGTPFLDRYGRDLTAEARAGNLGPIVGRREEILQVIQTLARQSKNNPVLLGEPGVGKTAVAEAVALRAAQGKDPHVLGGKRIVQLDVASLLGGAKYRGEFEKRLSQIIDECRRHPEVLLFIDEFHVVVGAGRIEGGGMDAAAILKPALANGEVRCIAATTVGEYHRYVESDPALERRFEKITIPEPSPQEARGILEGLREKWEKHHGVQISQAALQAAVDLSVRFDFDHRLPDKAIDLVDKAAARVRVPTLSMERLELSGASGQKGDRASPRPTVTDLVIAQVLSEKTGIPLAVVAGHLHGTSRSRLLEMESALKKRVIGQDDAVNRVCERLIVAHAGLGLRRGPLAVFLFLGPSGVGKTELARSLAAFLFGSEKEMIRLDMSEFMEKHSVAKLIGSPPGYVGYEEAGQLTGKLRTKPYSVVLLDEVEKAHPEVLDLFLQVFDEGRLTDSKGRTVDANNAIFILTSNVGAELCAGSGSRHSAEWRRAIVAEAGKRFRPEFLNRLDGQIVFQPLSHAAVKDIARLVVAEVAAALREKYGAELHVSEKALDVLASEGFSEEYGARHLRRTVHNSVAAPLSRYVLSGELDRCPDVLVDVDQTGIVIRPWSHGGSTI